MTKILLVEDDKSLREIYGVRLLAEGYDIVSAGDGEEALSVALREKPTLIISDVMMPKISGFEMLDLLRNNEVTKSIKVIMMTALSGDQHRERGENLGADRYLVKSQVGIEDVVNTVHEVLNDRNAEVQDQSTAIPVTSPLSTQMPAPNQSPINPPQATLPSAAIGVTVPPLPPTPPNIPVITTPNVPVASMFTPASEPTPAPAPTTQPTTVPEITSISDTPNISTAPENVPNLPPVAPPDAQPPETSSDVLTTPTNDASPTEETPSFQPKEVSEEDEDSQEKPYQPSVDLAQSSSHVSARVIQPTGQAVTPKIDIANLIANEDAKDIMALPIQPGFQSQLPAAPEPVTVPEIDVPEIQIDPTGAISIDTLPATPPDQSATFPNQS
ncbi:response regulator [Candidatus Saccharibacteria bacterium]|nr:response regulator [Candidatus Saccharibacteria bacterium]